jgi:hypothetical protein
MAIPLVLVFAVCIMVFASSLVFFRKESKQQNLSNIHFLQANFLAQSAIQMMLLKLSAFPQDACDAGVVYMGYCPFRGIIASSVVELQAGYEDRKIGLEQFFADCNSDEFPLRVDDINADDWKFAVTDFRVISAYTVPDEKELIISAQITSVGEVTMDRGQMETRKEQMIKSIKLTRKN